jgi:hypothetical protein
MRTSETITNLIAALLAARPTFAPVVKESTAQVGAGRTYTYANLTAVLEAVQPALIANGLLLWQAVDAESSCLITRLSHVSGQWVEATYPLAMDQAPQQLGSAVTYGRRYSLLALLSLGVEDDDAAAAEAAKPAAKPAAKKKPAPAPAAAPPSVGPWITPPQITRMFAIARQSGWSTDQIKAHLQLTLGIEHSREVPAARYDEICATFAVAPVADHADQAF